MSRLFKARRRSSISCFRDPGEYDLITEVQERVTAIYENDRSLFDEIDFANIEVKRYVLRFIRKQGFDVNKTVEMITRAMIWLKEKNVSHIDFISYPREYYETGGIVIEHSTDLDGNVVIYMRVKLFLISYEMKEFYERLFAFTCHQAIEKAVLRNKGITAFADCSDLSYENINLSFSFNLLKLVLNFMPDTLRLILIYNMPWFAKPAFKVIMKALPNDLSRILNVFGPNDLTKYISESNLPNFIKNPRAKFDQPFNGDVLDLDHTDCETIGIRNKDKEKMRDLYKRLQKKLDE